MAVVLAQIDMSSRIEQPRRSVRLGSEAERPFRDAWQALTLNITVRRTVGAARQFGRAWRIDETDIFGVGVGAIGIGAEALARPDREIGLDTLRPHLAGVGEIAAQHPELPVVHIGLVILDVGAEDRQSTR